MTLYGLAIVLVIFIVGALYTTGIISFGNRPQICDFNIGINCEYFNTGFYATNNTYATVLLLSNTQSYTISNPRIVINYDGINTSTYICDNGLIPPGSSFLCQVKMPAQLESAYTHQYLYLTVGDCSLLVSYIKNDSCKNPPPTTYVGNLYSQINQLPKISLFVVLKVDNNTIPANNTIDNITAIVYAFNRPIGKAPVNFSINNTNANLYTTAAVTFDNGSAFNYIYSNKSTQVLLTAQYEGATANEIITFFPSYIIQFVPYISQMSQLYSQQELKNAIITINSKNYLMGNLSTFTIKVIKNAPGTYVINTPSINVSNTTMLNFQNVSGCGASFTSLSGLIPSCDHNEVVDINYKFAYIIYNDNCSQGPEPSLTNPNDLANSIYTYELSHGNVYLTPTNNGEEISGPNGVVTFANKSVNFYTSGISIERMLISGYICTGISGNSNNLNLNTSPKYTQNINIQGNYNNLTLTNGKGNSSISGNNDNLKISNGGGNFILQGNENNITLSKGSAVFKINGNNDGINTSSGNINVTLQGNNDNITENFGNGTFTINGNNDNLNFSSGTANIILQGNDNTFGLSNCNVYINVIGSNNKFNLNNCNILAKSITGGGNKIKIN